VELRPLIRRKKLDRREHARPLVVPCRLFVLVRTSFGGLAAPFKFGRAVLSADPDRLPPPRRLLDQPNNVGLAALPAAAALQGTAAERHRQLRARRVAGARAVIAGGRSVPPADGEAPSMVLAPAPHGGRVTAWAVPAAGTRAAAAALRAAEAYERERRRCRCRCREIVELIERSDAHKSCLAAFWSAPVSHVNLTSARAALHQNNFPLCPDAIV